jgi:hypothetical protein
MDISRPTKFVIFVAIFIASIVLLIVGTGERDTQSNRFRLGFAPLVRIDAAPTDRWKVQSGLNIVSEQGVGAAGNFVEFPIWVGYRVSLRLFSPRWWQEERAK